VVTRKIVIDVGLGAYLVGVGMLAGTALDRVRFDRQRSEVLARYDQAVRDWQAYQIALEQRAGGQR
jgi:uncharacterized protein YutD